MRIRNFVVLGVVLGCSSARAGGPDPLAAACKKIEADARAKVQAALSGHDDSASADVVFDHVAPLGRCSAATGAAARAGRWALTLGDLEVEAQVRDDAIEGEAAVDGVPLRVTARGRAAFVTRDGKVVSSSLEPSEVEILLNRDGSDYFPHWPFIGKDLALEDGNDWSGDGVMEAALVGASGLAILVWDGAAVRPYAPAAVLPDATHLVDFDKDGRTDLASRQHYAFEGLGDSPDHWPLEVVAHALPNGQFSLDDAQARNYYAAVCGENGRSPWAIHRAPEATLLNIACARVLGVLGATIARGLEREIATLPKNYADLSDANELLTMQAEELVAWSRKEFQVALGRADGYRVVPVAKVTASSSEADFKDYSFKPELVDDGDRGTSWQPKKGKEPWIELRFATPTTVVALEIANGFQRVDALGDLFAMNRRATAITVSAGGRAVELGLEGDRRGLVVLVLPEPVTAEVLRVTIGATAEGSRWKNVAISELHALAK